MKCFIKLFLIIMCCFVGISPADSFGQKLEITGSALDNSHKLFVLTTPGDTKNLKVDKTYLKNPDRVFFDIRNSSLKGIKAKTELNDSPISSIKVAQFSSKPDIVRVVFTGEEEALDAIRVTTLNNVIFFNLDDITQSAPKSFVYKDDEPDICEADYYCYYEKLNVTLSKNLKGKEIKPKACPIKTTTPSEEQTLDEQKWNEIKTIDLPAKYTINSITKEKDGVAISGIGSLSVKSPFLLENPHRLVVDLPNSVLKKEEFLGAIELGKGEKIRLGQFEEKTVRMVIESPRPREFDIIISPDMRTLFVQKSKDLDVHKIPLLKKAKLEKFEAKQLDKQTTQLSIKATSPLVHSIKKVDDGVIVALLNMNNDDKFLEEIIPTKQFKTLFVVDAQNNFEGKLWKIPLKVSSRITTELSADAKELKILIKDKIFPYKDIVIKSGAKVMIDPGHGGKDAGAVKGSIYEKNLVLELAKDLRQYLKSHGVKVFMTRYSDKKVSLKSRVYKANKIRPDVFVSIHINSSRKKQIKGIETHWYRSRSKKLAKIIHNNMSLGINTADRGMFRSRFYVINHTRVPAVLVETGFISNKSERHSMVSSVRKRNTVKSIGNGILLYLAMKYESQQKATR